MYDFSMLGNCVSFIAKVQKHVNDKNCERLKDYICAAYDAHNPEIYKEHPCFDIIDKAIKDILRPNGWKVKVGTWKSIGKQIIIISPAEEYFHSKYEHV